MKFPIANALNVKLDLEGVEQDLGTLAWSPAERRAYFHYAPDFLAKPLPISPFLLTPKAGWTYPAPMPSEVQNIHALFNDSLPDGWGKLLFDRRLSKAGLTLGDITPIHRLCSVGKDAMGALAYSPTLSHSNSSQRDLDWFVEDVARIFRDEDAAEIDALLAAQGGAAGSRPKIMVRRNIQDGAFRPHFGGKVAPGCELWMVKGRHPNDREDFGIEEHAYALMARGAGLTIADTTIIETAKGNRLFATKRFDRNSNGRLHMQSVGGLINASHRLASLNYETLHRLTATLTRNSSDVARMFRHMVFNVLARNRDDHSKNHSFLMDEKGKWSLSPAYDLTYSTGPCGGHCTTIAGEADNPDRRHLLAVAKTASITQRNAVEIIDEVHSAIDRWPLYADEAGLGRDRSSEIDQALNGLRPPRGLS